MGLRLDRAEREGFERDGWILRTGAFPEAELGELRDEAEAVAARVRVRAERPEAGPEVRLEDGHRIQFSSRAGIQWEWREGSREIRLVEPCDHLSPRFERLLADERFVEPMKDLLGREDVAPFTTKLNLKRPREGSEFPWHQDFPYWYVRVRDDARGIATAILFLDDATPENGALRVVPGSHRRGPAPRDPDDPTRYLADPRRIDAGSEVAVPAPAGSLLLFGSLLVHRSSPNTSDRQRRALLYSYQPAGRPRFHEAGFDPGLLDDLP